MTEEEAVSAYREEVLSATTPEELDAAYERERARREASAGNNDVAPDAAPDAAKEDLSQRVADLEAQLARSQAVAARAPFLLVPADGGGPGNDNHQVSWSLAMQEAARRGEWLEEWGDKPA
jgi:hypothetical protein